MLSTRRQRLHWAFSILCLILGFGGLVVLLTLAVLGRF